MSTDTATLSSNPDIGRLVADNINHLNVEWFCASCDLPETLWKEFFPLSVEGLWWYRALENSRLTSQFEFLYGLVSVHDPSKPPITKQPIAIVPAFLMDVPIDLVAPKLVVDVLNHLKPFTLKFLHQRTLFVGSPCAEEGSVGLSPDITLTQIAKALTQALKAKARQANAEMIVWKDFPEKFQPALNQLCNQAGFFPITSFPNTIINFSSANYDDYITNLPSTYRYGFKKKLRKSKAQYDFEVSIIQSPSASVVQEIFGLFWQTYEKGKTKFERLSVDFFKEIAQFKHSYFILLRNSSDKKLLAFMLCFQLGAKTINKFMGFDYSVAKESFLYFRLWEEAVKWSLSQKASELQSGQTGYRAKIDVGHQLVPLTNYGFHRNFLVNFIYARIAKTISWTSLDFDLAVYLKAHPEAMQKD